MDDPTVSTIAVYDTIAEQYSDQAERNAPIPERDKFCSLLPSHASILDAGCGSGRDCAFFSDRGFAVTGVDLSDGLLAIARKKASHATFLKADLRELTFPVSSFDGIWACASLLHLQKIQVPEVLHTFYKILKPNGCLYIQVKAGSGEMEKEEQSTPGFKRFFAFYSKEEIEQMVKNAGFVTREVYSINESDRGSDRNIWWIMCFGKKI